MIQYNCVSLNCQPTQRGQANLGIGNGETSAECGAQPDETLLRHGRGSQRELDVCLTLRREASNGDTGIAHSQAGAFLLPLLWEEVCSFSFTAVAISSNDADAEPRLAGLCWLGAGLQPVRKIPCSTPDFTPRRHSSPGLTAQRLLPGSQHSQVQADRRPSQNLKQPHRETSPAATPEVHFLIPCCLHQQR